jgi:hypothetical protein
LEDQDRLVEKSHLTPSRPFPNYTLARVIFKFFRLPLSTKYMHCKMKQIIGILLFAVLLSGLSSCHNTTVSKPDDLISKDKFMKMMVDVYLISGINTDLRNPKNVQKVTSADLYASLLKKYSVDDKVFIRSLIYYSSFPKEFEKMHVEIMDNLNQMELQFKPKDKLKVGKQ